MKKKITTILLTLALLAGCQSQAPAAPAAPSATDAPDMEAIIQQSVDEAIKEKLEQIEEEQKKKDEEIAKLKEQLEDLTASSDTSQEVPPEESQTKPSASSSQAESEPVSSQAELPPQPEPEPAPKKTAPSSSGQGFDLRNLYPGINFEEDLGEGEGESEDDPDENEPAYKESSSFDAEGFANTAFDLINEARQNKGLHTVEMSSDAMALAEMRVPELEEKYSHTRPDGTRMSKEYLCGEIINENADTPEIAVSSWLDSPSHYDIIMAERYHSAGIACYKGTNGVIYWCMLFFR